MKKIVIETFQITRLKEKLQFQINIPDNAILLTGIEVSNDLNMISDIAVPKHTHRGIGIIRLQIADKDDCFFSEMLHQDYAIPPHERIGNVSPTVQLWSEIFKPYKPFAVQELSAGTIILGYYEDLVGYLKPSPTLYTISITLHYQVQ